MKNIMDGKNDEKKVDVDIKSIIFEAKDENIKYCAEYLRLGGIVGMPTETVYGLAANAFDIVAVRKIFEYKGRPLSDPLIVHITNINMAKELAKFDDKTLYIFEKLANKFWPGPLTIVLKANFEKLSPILTANTEFIGLRFPKNDIAQKLIDYSGVPIAAPSANKFCHVSPVNPYHVFEDFKEFPVYILDGGISNFCMESTVIKLIIDDSETSNSDSDKLNKIQILRMGAISKNQLEDFLEEIYINDSNIFDNKIKKFKVEFLIKEKAVPTETEIKNEYLQQNNNADDSNSKMNQTLGNNPEAAEFKINKEAPGQFLKHYSPHIDTYIFDFEEACQENITKHFYVKGSELKDCVVLDYKQIIESKFPKDKFKKILDLSPNGDHTETMHNLYNYLRLMENESNPKYLLLCDIEKYMPDNPDKITLVDRVLKASSSRKIYYLGD